MYIYADILIITNIYVDFLIIQSTKAITHSPMKTVRGVIAAAAGSLFSLVIFLPSLPLPALLIINVFSAAVIVYAAFSYNDMRSYIRRLFVFFLSGFIFAGIGTAAAYLTGGQMIISRNGVIYCDFSASALIVTSVIGYAAIALYKRFGDCHETTGEYTVIVSDCGKTVSFKAIADTGNVLKDSFTGKPVIVCSHEILRELYGDVPDEKSFSENPYCVKRWRLIPIATVSGNSLMAVINPPDICIRSDESGKYYITDAYLGAGENDTAVFHPKLLI